MERDPSYDELITPPPTKGHVILLQGEPENEGVTDLGAGVSFSTSLVCKRLLTLDPLDGPVHLEQWTVGNAVVYDGDPGDDPREDPSAEFSPGTHIYGLMPDGRRVLTGPVVEIRRDSPADYPRATVVDGLVFSLGEPDPLWVEAWGDSTASQAVDQLVDAFSPLSLTPFPDGKGLQ